MKAQMTYGSLFSGIGGFDLGFDWAGMRCAWQVEKDKKAQSVLTNHWPNVKKYEDVRNVGKRNLSAVNVLIGGFPCQDVSLAGHRKGLAGERSGLWFEFSRIVSELKPQWVVIENVTGLLSSCGCIECQAARRILRIHKYLRGKRKFTGKCPICNAGARLLKSHRGRDMALILSGLAKLGYWWAYRVLDAQFFGVPQRRRNVFIVASLTRGRPQEVLFERESSPWDTPPRREAGPGTAAAPQAGVGIGGSGLGCALRSNPSHSGDKGDGGVNTNLVIPAIALSNRGLSTGEKTETLRAESHGALPLVAFTQNSRDEVRLINGDGQIVGAIAAQPRIKQQTYLAFSESGPGWWRDGIGTLRERDYKDGNSGLICGALPAHSKRHGHAMGTQQAAESGHLIAAMLNSGGNDGGFRTEPGEHLVVGFDSSRAQYTGDVAAPLRVNGAKSPGVNDGKPDNMCVYYETGVRRLTPLECERLQGFPDYWTKYGVKVGKIIEQSDSARYRQLGNAVAVPVSHWLGQRIIRSLQI